MVKLVQLKKVALLWLPVLLWAGLIFYLSSLPNLSVGEGTADFLTRKPAHIAEYAVLFVLIFRALRGSFLIAEKKLYLSAAVFTLFYAVTDEIHQMLVPSREGKIYDLGFDLLGIFLGMLILRLFLRRRYKYR